MKRQAVVVCSDLSSNCLGRAIALAELLATTCDVRVVGHQYGREIWAPVNIGNIPVERLRGYTWFGIARWWRENMNRVRADFVVISKPLPAPMLYGLALLREGGTNVALDVDDDELALFRQIAPLRRHVQAIVRFATPRSYYHALWATRLTRRFQRIICASTSLQRTHGGTLIYHARRKEMIDGEAPQYLQNKLAVMRAHKAVVFLGTPQLHKGLDVLARAVAQIEDPAVILSVIGCRDPKRTSAELAAFLPAERLYCIGSVPLQSVAACLSAAQVVVIPQQSAAAAEFQTPAKLFDAMYCGSALVTTNVGDIPAIVGDAALVMKNPGNPVEMASAIRMLLSNPSLRRSLRERIKARFESTYSFDVAAERLRSALRGHARSRAVETT